MGWFDLEGSKLDVPANEMTDRRGAARNSQHIASKLNNALILALALPCCNAYARAGKHDKAVAPYSKARSDPSEVVDMDKPWDRSAAAANNTVTARIYMACRPHAMGDATTFSPLDHKTFVH
ncbi:hypothetical protein MUK42_35757 [Musa troglodytarum]|uniref:Uncharacterized protein n=1 Tax=Musa troglodytarum TaxID=320322 RepID=A0A9E7KW40_9LILI|nr:hypothetical protein MUK42_35757 [Musa troglodytarum]URE34374.1 hypothetical protein MUK42_35757 [Musa troglodytarum]